MEGSWICNQLAITLVQMQGNRRVLPDVIPRQRKDNTEKVRKAGERLDAESKMIWLRQGLSSPSCEDTESSPSAPSSKA